MTTFTTPSDRFADFDDCLEAAEAEFAAMVPGLDGGDVLARWGDAQREFIVLDVPNWAVPPTGSKWVLADGVAGGG